MAHRKVWQKTASTQTTLEMPLMVEGSLALTTAADSGVAVVPPSSAVRDGLPPLTKAQVHY
jgi:hypothetical protein